MISTTNNKFPANCASAIELNTRVEQKVHNFIFLAFAWFPEGMDPSNPELVPRDMVTGQALFPPRN